MQRPSELAEIDLSPGHLPVGFEFPGTRRNGSGKKETHSKDLSVDHLFQGIISHLIGMVAYLEIPGR